jgi:TonB family protein
MKFSSGKRIGQSGQQLTTAVLFSSFLHAILFLFVLILHFAVMPRITVPPFYAVKLVDVPSDLAAPAPPSQTPPVPQKQQAKPAPAKPAAKKGSDRTARTAPKGALPDLAPAKKKTVIADQGQTTGQEIPSAPPSTEPASGSKNESVSPVVAQQADFKFGYYLAQVRNKIGQNWNPPPDAPDARVRVIFSVNRSGWVEEVRLEEKESKSTFQFQQAAIRAIRASNPFPALPEGYFKQKLDFSVDLMAVE